MTRRPAQCTAKLGGEEQSLALWYDDLKALRVRVKHGPLAMLRRFLEGDWEAEEVYEVVLLALEGGGATPDMARSLCDRYLVQNRDWIVGAQVAALALTSALSGPGELAKKKESESPETTSTSSSSTPTQPSADSPPSI